ncbi:MAG: response regulator [Chlorobiaceae bacterium]|nr:response regulator [Chlorobiaceae bacterium]
MMSDLSSDDRGNVLIVDDTLPNLRLLSIMLTSNGYQVSEAMDGPAALHSVRIDPPDMILLDIRMPGMDGYEVCQRLKADETTRNIPVIFVSALDDQTGVHNEHTTSDLHREQIFFDFQRSRA